MPSRSRACAFTTSQVAMPPSIDVVAVAKFAIGTEIAIR